MRDRLKYAPAVLLALFLWTLWPTQPRLSASAIVEQAPAPTATTVSGDAPAAETPDADPYTETRVVIHARLGSWHSPGDTMYTSTQPHLNRVWPDQIDLPEGEDIDAFLEAFATGYHGVGTEAQILELMRPRLTRPPTGPWDAMLRLEIERLDAKAKAQDEYTAWLDGHDIPAHGDPDRAVLFRAAFESDPPPNSSHQPRIDQLDAFRNRWAGHEVADIAGVYLLRHLAAEDPVEMGDEAVALMAQNPSAGVQYGTLEILGNMSTVVDLDSEDLDVLGDTFDNPEFKFDRLSLARMGTQISLDQGDDARAVQWMARHDPATRQLCDEKNVQQMCVHYQDTRDTRASYLAAKGLLTPPNWRAAVIAMARRCHLDGNTPADNIEGNGDWTGTVWAWTDWTATSSFTACMAATPHEGPQPPDGAQITLAVLAI